MKKYCVLKAICDFSKNSNCLKVLLFIVFLLFCEQSENGVKGILLYKMFVKTSEEKLNFLLFDRKHTGLQRSQQKAKAVGNVFCTV